MDTRTAFSDSNDISGSSSICNASIETLASSEPSATELQSLRRLSENLDSIFDSPNFDSFADAKISVSDGREVSVHRCVLSARSSYFKNLFSSSSAAAAAVGKEQKNPKFELKELARDFNVGFDALVSVLAYVYGGKVRSLPRDACSCVDDDCSHTACRPAVDFMVEVLYVSYTFEISELVALYQRHLLEILDKVATDDILVILSVANICGKASEKLLTMCVDIAVKSDIDSITLEKNLPQDVVKQIMDSRLELQSDGQLEAGNSFPDKHVKRIHRALESDDVELVRMLLKEGHTTLDDAYALHYAMAYCDAKTTTELLDLGLADVNLRNGRGYTVLHVAAMRKEPNIIVSLLTKGARPLDLTLDGRKALQISKRLTRAVDYRKSTEEGKSSPKDRLCIEVLEQAESREPLLGEASVSLAIAGDDLRVKLLYLENRVALAKLLFPMEAKVAMDIAQVDGTSEYLLANIQSKNSAGAQGTTMDLNDAPFRMKEEHLNRLRALSRTVELGKRFFPRCSEVLNKIMDNDDLSELAFVGNDTAEERLLKKRRYMELQDLLSQAFTQDKEENDTSTVSSSTSSTSMLVAKPTSKFTPRNTK